MSVERNIEQNAYENKLDYDYDRIAWRNEEHKLVSRFRTDLYKELLAMNIPEEYCAGTVDYAWQEGHSGGYREVLGQAMNIATVVFGK